uniref:Uncharacterized protein n=1 Tax=Rhizophora mucronata TaxID=61149 RepID=A0A2P2N1R8_RHIMU
MSKNDSHFLASVCHVTSRQILNFRSTYFLLTNRLERT